jgi:hypothetical protein
MISVDSMENLRKIPLSGLRAGRGIAPEKWPSGTRSDFTLYWGFPQAFDPQIRGPLWAFTKRAIFPVTKTPLGDCVDEP